MESIFSTEYLIDVFEKTCNSSTVGSESTLHQLSPYIGKIKSSIAKFLIENFTSKGDMVYDPFCGAGTIPLEACLLERNVIANDLSYYAFVLTQAKLFPPCSLEETIDLIEKLSTEVASLKKHQKIDIPEWVSVFFHFETLQEIIAWMSILRREENYFLIACLLGILHHQRPGFLSFPSSHTVPYLRIKKFPKNEYPHLYEYREVKERLLNKVKRAYKRFPNINNDILRACYNCDASKLTPDSQIDCIITSPPYMRQLNYARDNRLRLWFLEVQDYKTIDDIISPRESNFLSMMNEAVNIWDKILKQGGKIILFLGDNYSKAQQLGLPELIEKLILEKSNNYRTLFKQVSIIPDNRRVRREHKGNKQETILVFEKLLPKI